MSWIVIVLTEGDPFPVLVTFRRKVESVFCWNERQKQNTARRGTILLAEGTAMRSDDSQSG